MKKLISAYIAVLLLITGCSSDKRLAPARYVQYMQDISHHAKQAIVSGKLNYVVQLATPEYMVCREMIEGSRAIDITKVNQRLNELKGTVFFLIDISSSKEKSVADEMQKRSAAESMNMYYATSANNDVTLLSDSAQLSPSVYHFENNYGLAPYNTILVGFNVGDLTSDIKLVFNDRFNDEPFIQASYSKETLTNLPALEIK